MLFSPRKELDNGLFIKLIGLISFIHLFVLCLLFVSEYLSQGKAVVMSMGSGARVRMLPGAPSRAGGGSNGQPLKAPAQTEKVSSAQRTVEKEAGELKTSATKAVPAIQAPNKKELVTKTDAGNTKTPVKEPVKQKEAAAPGFSALKKSDKAVPDYSPIKKAPIKDEKTASDKSRAISSVDGYSALAKKVDSKPSEQELSAKAERVQATHSANAEQSSSSTISATTNAGAGYSSGTGGGSGYGVVDEVDIHGAEPGWSHNEYAQEFFRYYAEPPGFKDRETFTITFEVVDGKALSKSFSPRGSEPLIIYAAAKDAILRMSFVRRSYVEKKVFII